MTGRIVSSDVARNWNHHEGDLTEGDLAHTVVVQATQIAAVLALHAPETEWLSEPWCSHCQQYKYPCPTARALGVTA
jgi:hypothetical protein